jgi:Tol biopolymer transport system component
MALAAGSKLGPYEIVAPLGAGGMGEVYRARDTRLDRSVAIKILPAQFSIDPVRKQRFEREAKTISSLNHPHICVLYDVGSQDGVDYLVMECVEGETLAKRLEKGALPLEQVLKYGTQIADALDKAHRSGVVHRDLKPGNIMLTATGAKLLDFGLAKPAAPLTSVATLTAAVTQSSPMTEQGAIVGTFQYMSPEQVEAKELDGRSDIFSLGAVLYEMLTDQRAFPGKSQLSVASAILEKEPASISTVKPMTPPALDHAIRRCLAKDPEERWQTARDLALELKWIAESGLQVGISALGAQKKGRQLLAWTLALAAAVLLGGLVGGFLFELRRGNAQQAAAARLQVSGPALFFIEGYQSVSPDGRYLAITAFGSETVAAPQPPMVWLRPLNASKMTPLKETNGAADLFWSPDSRYIAYFANGMLRKIPLEGGTPQTICEATGVATGSWGQDGSILYTAWHSSSSGLFRVSASGGTATSVNISDGHGGQMEGVSWPYFLPDGEHFLFRANLGDIYVGSVRTGVSSRVVRAESRAEYSSGYIFYVLEGNLVAHRFDMATLQVSGEPVPMAAGVRHNPATGSALFGVSSGLLSYQAGAYSMRLALRDRTGGILKEIARGEFGATRVSPDGHRLAAELDDPANSKPDIWIYDLDRNTGFRFASHPGGDWSPIWSPDGQQLIYSSQMDGQGQPHLYRQSLDGSPPKLLLASDGQVQLATDWSPDGTRILYTEIRAGCSGCVNLGDTWMLSLRDDKKAALLQTPPPAGHAQFSPDGKWIAFVEMDAADFGVYVMPAGGGERQRVSIGSGIMPTWRHDGKELFYQSLDSFDYWSVSVIPGVRLYFGKPVSLFTRDPLDFAFFDVLPDGNRLISRVALPGAQAAPPTTVVLNWTAELKKK